MKTLKKRGNKSPTKSATVNSKAKVLRPDPFKEQQEA